MMRIFSAISISALIVVGCTETTKPSQETETAGSMTTRIANPWTDHSSLEEAAAEAGRSMKVPEKLAEGKRVLYRAIKGGMLEVIIGEGDGEVRLRSSKGPEDNTGVYNSAVPKRESIEGVEVVVRVDRDGKSEAAYWQAGAETQSVSIRAAVGEEEMKNIVREVIIAQ